MKQHARQLLDFIRDNGGENARYVDNGRGAHARIKFTFKGEEHVRIISRGAGPNDWHAIRNELAILRAVLGVERQKKSDRPKKRQDRRVPRKAGLNLPAITAPINGFEQLRAHKLSPMVTQMRLDEAWLFFWRACMNRVGGESKL